MKTENLAKACDSFAFFYSELREAHTDAVHSGNDFAEIVMFSLIEQAAKMQTKLARIKDAAVQAAAVKHDDMKMHLWNGANKIHQAERQLRQAYDFGVKTHQQGFEILLHGLLEDLGALQRRLGRITDAAILEENFADERKPK